MFVEVNRHYVELNKSDVGMHLMHECENIWTPVQTFYPNNMKNGILIIIGHF